MSSLIQDRFSSDVRLCEGRDRDTAVCIQILWVPSLRHSMYWGRREVCRDGDDAIVLGLGLMLHLLSTVMVSMSIRCLLKG